MVLRWFLVTKTIGSNGFPMVAYHWSDDGMVTIHRSGLDLFDNILLGRRRFPPLCTGLVRGIVDQRDKQQNRRTQPM